jgi:phosphoserine phosphatase RsbU/P
MRGAVRWLACLALALCAAARAQIVDATHIGTPIDLSSQTWRYTPSDDPRYADPTFDDGLWKPISLLKSFTHQSYPQTSGTWWMRLHVRVPVGATNIALSTDLATYQIYVNGELIGQQGGFPNHPRLTRGLQEFYPIPDGLLRGDSLVVAIRNWTPPPHLVPETPPNPRLFLGDSKLLQQDRDLFFDSRFFSLHGGNIAEGIIAFMLGIWALVLFRAQPGHREYLWLAIMCLSDTALAAVMEVISLRVVPSLWTAMPSAIANSIAAITLVLFVCAFLKVRVNWWIRVFCVALLWPPVAALGSFYVGWSLSLPVILDLLAVTPIDVFAPILAFRQWRRGDREAGALLLSLIILGFVDYAFYIDQIRYVVWHRGGPLGIPNLKWGRVEMAPFNLTSILFYATIGGIMLHRSLRITREQQRTASELEEGRSVQAFLLGRDASAPGYTVESAYLPAQEVGGDFFQTIASSDGSLLAVIGDVAGKGLQAAMRVSMLIGAVRLSPNEHPAALLGKLNEVLLQDGSSGFTTCLAARLNTDGTATIANAGHLAPYLNGRELPIDGGLPLGVASDAVYSEQTFPFAAGDALLLLSDGVIEATSPSGELFGFDRMAETAAQVTAATSLAETARAFGHQDDITVLLIHRLIPDPGFSNAHHPQ